MTKDKLVYSGKSKDVYAIESGPYAGKYRLVFTDKATGYIEGGKVIFDPGRDVVVGEIPGKGAVACRFATHFFKLLQKHSIPSHYVETISANEMIVEPAQPLSMRPVKPDLPGAEPLANLEFTWRNSATGSFWRRYPFVKPCKNISTLVEIWTKGAQDVLITADALVASGALTRHEVEQCERLVREIAGMVTAEFASRSLHVLDGKFELGRLQNDPSRIVIIDEISPDVLRVCNGYKPKANDDCAIWEECTRTSVTDGRRGISHKYQVSPVDLIKEFLSTD